MDLGTVIELAERRRINPKDVGNIEFKPGDFDRLEARCKTTKIVTAFLTAATVVTFGLFVYAARNYGLAASPLLIPSILSAAHARLQYDLYQLYHNILSEKRSAA